MQKDVEKLKKKVLALSTVVEESVLKALDSFQKMDQEEAHKVIEQDVEIDNLEIEVEEECLKILALHQPFAIDLRFLVSVLKINNDLERIGDLAVNIAELTTKLSPAAQVEIPHEIDDMAARTRSMFRRSLDSLVNLDSRLAREIFADDDAVDDLNRKMYHYFSERIQETPSKMDALAPILFISRYLERIADLATNIGEDVIYMVEGKIVRHGKE
jgi:phosphate transport system protein